ncbi:MAG: hypothetical protein U0840_26415 [Gemmataceae bacterium]
MMRLLLGAVLAGVVQFLWGFVFWTALQPMLNMMGRMPEEERVVQVLRDVKPETNVYFLPWPGGTPEEQESMMQRHQEGPLVQIIYQSQGQPAMDPKLFLLGYLHMVGMCLLAGILLCLAGPGLNGYLARYLFVVLLGVFAAFALNLAQPIWFHHPWRFQLLHSIFDVGNWVLGGLVLAAFVRRSDS